MFKRAAQCTIVFCCTAHAAAQVKTYEGAGGYITDGAPFLPETTQFDINVNEHGDIAELTDIVLVGFSHTWAGDLVITLTHQDSGTSLVLLDRPGVPESFFGDGADFDGTDYTFQDGGFFYDHDLRSNTVEEHILAAVGGSIADTFAGLDKFGTWSLTFDSWAAGDVGNLDGWMLIMNNIPAPGAIALLILSMHTQQRRRPCVLTRSLA